MSRINQKNLTIYHNTTDITNDLSVFKGTKTLILGATSFLYIGYRKPIHSLYIDLQTANTASNIVMIEKWNGTDWDIIDRQDDTFGLKKSGFIYTDNFADEAKTTYQGKELYWLRLSLDATSSSMSFRFLNLVFNSLEDLTMEERDIELFYPLDPDTEVEVKSFLGSQIAAREEILNKLNNVGKYKYNGTDVSLLNQWDIDNVNELRNPSKFLTLHKIFINTLDNKDGSAKLKADYYWSKYEASFDEFKSLLTLDLDDDGVIDDNEKPSNTIGSYRMGR